MTLTTAFGIPIRVHWSFLALLAGASLWSLVQGGLSGLVLGGAIALALFSSVVLHELGHALAARRYGIHTEHITLYPFGGIAAIRGMPREPRQELVIALAGPAVNGVLAVVFGMAYLLFGGSWLAAAAALNIILGLFNLIPAFPMDGGRVLRALLAGRLGWLPATELSLRIGRVFAWAFVGLGVFTTSWNLLLIGGFLLFAISAERQRLMWVSTHGGAAPWTRGPRAPQPKPRPRRPARWSIS